MPKKSNSASTAGAANGGVRAKKPMLSVDQVYGTTSDDDEEEAGSHSYKIKPEAFNELILMEVEKAAQAAPREQYKKFDFKKVHIPGHSNKELRAEYERLRLAAFRHVRHLPVLQEVSLIRQYGRRQMMKAGNAPKRPPSAYLRFMEDAKPKLLEKNPELARDYRSLVQLLGQKWRGMSSEKKKKYEDAYKADVAEFYREHPELKKKDKPAATAKKAGKKTAARLPPAKTAFDFFAEAKSQEYAEKYDLKEAELQQKLAAKFQKLSDRKRAKWETRAREAMDEYIQTLMNPGSHASNDVAAADDPILAPQDDPILARSPVDIKEKKPKQKKRTASEAAHDDDSESQEKKKPASSSKLFGSPSKKTAQATLNSWLDY